MKSKKYEDILDAAREKFWKYGFRRVSIEEICVQAKSSKMTFTVFFLIKQNSLKQFLIRNLKKESSASNLFWLMTRLLQKSSGICF
jgi:hypothetical protein